MSHTILIADDTLISREALCKLFEREEGFLLGKVHSALEAQELRASLHSQQTGGSAMMYDLQLARGAICRDATGLRVRVEDVDIHDYVHFSVLDRGGSGEVVAESGQMSHVAFVRRFSQPGNMFASRKVA